MEVTEITQRGYVLIFCLSIFFFNIAKIKQQTNQSTKHSPLPPKPNQPPKHLFKVYGPLLP